MICNEIFFGDCREQLRLMKSFGAKAQMCVTSPPYFGLRDYGHEGQIGLEETPEQFIAELVEVFRCVRDVLADDGTLWVNMGDSYAANRGRQVPSTLMNGDATNAAQAGAGKGMKAAAFGLKEKDLIGIPWMLAFALRADGWYLRQDIIWHKPNPMPESVTDRCTKAHEYIFLLSKSPRYFYDAEAAKEKAVGETPVSRMRLHGGVKAAITQNGGMESSTLGTPADGKRNRRSVWSIATRPYKGAHFATFPPALIEPCILAGSRPGDIVLDPFMGSGTTAAEAKRLGRGYLGCELNPDYAPLIADRIDAV